MKRSGKILLEGTIEEFKKHCKGADNREYLLINTEEIKKDGTYTVYKQDNNTERVVPISAKGKYGKQPFIPYNKQYLTFEALSDGTFVFNGSTNGGNTNNISYSTDNGATWSKPSQTVTVNVNSGKKVLWKGNDLTPYSNSGIGAFSTSTAEFNIQGNVMSLLYGDNFVGQTDLSGKNYAFFNLFKNTKCINADNFILPATTLAKYCYKYMFMNCILLTTAPELPATGLSQDCYNTMFKGCTSLTQAPELQSTSLAQNCYNSMFSDCTSLAQAPELPATTLVFGCYHSMFQGCTSLTTAPQLPATTLATSCYYGMFNGCASLTTAPQLNVTTLAQYCYSAMFANCTSLITAPQLPATTLAQHCYSSMFSGCTSLTQAPQLPATTLTDYCYDSMFGGCTSLTTAPELPADTLTESCYEEMFSGCSSLNYIKMLATDISEDDCLLEWVNGVASSGTFVKNSAATWTKTGISGIPTEWTVEDATE